MLVTPCMSACWGFGDASIGMTAGSGIDGAGERDRLDEKEERRLWVDVSAGGFIGSELTVGVPGADGTGEPSEKFEAESTERA